jgi:hypothetical protein
MFDVWDVTRHRSEKPATRSEFQLLLLRCSAGLQACPNDGHAMAIFTSASHAVLEQDVTADSPIHGDLEQENRRLRGCRLLNEGDTRVRHSAERSASPGSLLIF